MILHGYRRLIHGRVIGCLLLAVGWGGCGSEWRPEPVVERPNEQRQETLLQACLQVNQKGERLYRRTSISDPSRQVQYLRRSRPELMIEGVSEERFAFLDPLLKMAIAQKKKQVPEEQQIRNLPIAYFELNPALSPFPVSLLGEERVTDTAEIYYYSYKDGYEIRGTLERIAEIEGVEMVETPAGEFQNCLRIRVMFALRFPWLLSLDWESYLWLSPEAGEVLRVQDFSGWFLIFRFHSGHRFELIEYRPPDQQDSRPVEAPVAPDPGWKRGSLVLEGKLTRPTVHALAVEFDQSDDGLQAVPETRPVDAVEVPSLDRSGDRPEGNE